MGGYIQRRPPCPVLPSALFLASCVTSVAVGMVLARCPSRRRRYELPELIVSCVQAHQGVCKDKFLVARWRVRFDDYLMALVQLYCLMAKIFTKSGDVGIHLVRVCDDRKLKGPLVANSWWHDPNFNVLYLPCFRQPCVTRVSGGGLAGERRLLGSRQHGGRFQRLG